MKTMKHGRLKTLNYFTFWNSFALDAARPGSIWKLNWVHRIAHFFIVWSWQIIKGFELFQECVLRRQVVDSNVHRTLSNTDHCIIVKRHRSYNQVRKKYENIEDIIDDYFNVRLEMYQTRKSHMIKLRTYECSILENKARYITEILNETIDLRKKKKDVIIQLLKSKNYTVFDNDEEYKYLLKMSMDSVSEENVEKLTKEFNEKMEELNLIKSTSIEHMWLHELQTLEQMYVKSQK